MTDPASDSASDPASDRSVGRRHAVQQRAPVWPLTLLLVVIAYVLAAWDSWVALISGAPFFADIPSRDSYIRGGMAALTGVLPCLLLALVGWLAGSRWGLLLIGLPTVVLLGVGVSMLADPGDPRDPDPGRAVVAADVFGEFTLINWVVCAGLAAVIAGMVWRRRARG